MSKKQNRGPLVAGSAVAMLVFILLLITLRGGSLTVNCQGWQVCPVSAVVSPSGVVTVSFANQGTAPVSGVLLADAIQVTNCGPPVNGVSCHFWSASWSLTTTLLAGSTQSISVGTGQPGTVWSTQSCGWCTWNGALVSGTEYDIVVYFMSCYPSTTCPELSPGVFAQPQTFTYGGVPLNELQPVVGSAQVYQGGVTYTQGSQTFFSGSANSQPGVLSP